MRTCERTQAALSELMDGAYLPRGTTEAVEAHVESCPTCRDFRDRAARVRAAVRIRPAERIPDLTEPIMVAVRERADVRRPGSSHRRRRSSGTLAGRRFAPMAAALVAGVIAGSVVVGGPWPSPSSGPMAAAALVRDVQAAAPAISSYQGHYSIVERGLSPLVPERTLWMDVAFLAPGRFRIDVHDQTAYPSPAWTPTDITYIANGTSTMTTGPTGCPSGLPVGVCPPTRTSISRQTRFDAVAPLATDLVLPLTTLGSAHGIRVLGTGELAGRSTVRVELTFARAAPLLPFLGLGGTWRPFFEQDRVVLTLDRTDWFPLRATVYPSDSPARRAWELRFGLPIESSSQPILDVQMTSLQQRPPAAGLFAIPGGAPGRVASLAQLSRAVGYVPVTPDATQGLRLTSVVAPHSAAPDAPASLLTYTRGLSYVVIGERPGRGVSGLLGSLDLGAAPVTLPGGGIGYFEAATGDHGNVLSIHSAVTDVFLESDLPLPQLLSIAASLPIRGQAVPVTGAFAR